MFYLNNPTLWRETYIRKLGRITETTMKIQDNYLGLARRYFRGKSWEVTRTKESKMNDGSYLQLVDNDPIEGEKCRNVLQLPDDVWLGILSNLQMIDVVR